MRAPRGPVAGSTELGVVPGVLWMLAGTAPENGAMVAMSEARITKRDALLRQPMPPMLPEATQGTLPPPPSGSEICVTAPFSSRT